MNHQFCYALNCFLLNEMGFNVCVCVHEKHGVQNERVNSRQQFQGIAQHQVCLVDLQQSKLNTIGGPE